MTLPPLHPSTPRPLLFFLPDATAIALRDPILCPGCRRPHCLFLNRLGSTLCTACDAARKGE